MSWCYRCRAQRDICPFSTSAAPAVLLSLLNRQVLAASAGIRIQNHLASVLQVNGLHATCVRLPLREIFDQHAIFPGELARTEMQSNSLRHVQSWKPGQNDSEILRVSQIDFADEVRRTRTDQIGVAHKFLVGLHALFAFGTRHAVGKPGDDWEMQVLALRAVENYAISINEREFVAISHKGNGCALGNIHPNPIRQDALHAGVLHPGNLLDLTAPAIEWDTEHASTSIFVKRLKDRFSTDHAVAVHFHLIRLQQKNLGRVKEEVASDVERNRPSRCRQDPQKKIPVEGRGLPAEFFASNLHRLLAPEVARLVIFDKLRPICLAIGGRRAPLHYAFRHSVFGHERYALHTTTSFSSLRP